MLGQASGHRESLGSMATLRSDFQSRLVEALTYALRATREHFREHDDKRGDVIFGFELNEEIHDLATIIDICSLYTEYFENINQRLLPSVKEEVSGGLEKFLSLTQDAIGDEKISSLREKATLVVSSLHQI